MISDTLSRPADGSAPKPSRSHSFDAGAAWGYLALQALHSGYHAHGMTVWTSTRLPAFSGVPADYHIEAAVAIGKLGDKSILPEGLQAKESPNGRKPLEDVVFEGKFKA